MRKASSKVQPSAAEGISPELLAELKAAAALPDEAIDLSDPDAPEVLDWSGAVRGKFYKPRKRLVSVRYDEDVLAYFEALGPGYQTRMNRVLRASMLRGIRRQQQRRKKTEQST
jgi:uncharacterized protein (DUF4415 family)